jgi:mannose/fructose/N-acetylgalactosamine-specific phosphotransferase system component IID
VREITHPGEPARPARAADPGSGFRRLGLRLLGSTFLRSLTIQGSWNYRTMIGGGFAFTLLPLLRRVRGDRGPELEAALARHSEHFNAHPYLVGVALGAVARLELDGERSEVVTRFKEAVRGPLGGLGDTLVWAGWLPATLLVALTAAWGGVAPIVCVIVFLVLYNVGHLGLRAWAFNVGFREGVAVGARLREAALRDRADLLHRSGALLLGLLCGLLLVSGEALGGTGRFWSLLAIAAFALGLTGGRRVWRPTALAVVGIILLIFLTRGLL